MPYLRWIYNADVQQEFTDVNNCVIDMLNNLPTDKYEISLTAHNSDYDCRLILNYLEHVKPIVKSNRFLQIKATCFNPIQKHKITLTSKDSYKLMPMPLR